MNIPRLVAIVFWCVCAVQAYNAWKRPMYNWDMLPYIGAAFQIEERDDTLWFNRTLEALKEGVSPRHYQIYTAVPLAANVEALRQQMPFYTIKPFYVGLLYGLYKLGMPIGVASYTISVAAALAVAALFFFAAMPGWTQWKWRLAALAFILLYPRHLIAHGRYSTPDMLATCMGIYMFYALLIWRNLRLGFCFGALAVLARPDMLPLCAMLMLTFGWQHKKLPQAAALLAGLAAMFLLVLNAAGYYGWQVHLEYHFVNRMPDAASLTGDITLSHYLLMLRNALASAITSPAVMFMGIWTMLTVEWAQKSNAGMNIAWACCALKILLFPQWEDRLLFICYLMVFVSGALLLAQKEPDVRPA